MRKWIFFDSIKSILENVRHKNMGISSIDLCLQSHFFTLAYVQLLRACAIERNCSDPRSELGTHV